MWLFHSSSCIDKDGKKVKLKKRKQHVFRPKAKQKQKCRSLGVCHRIAGRRYQVKVRKYRMKGKIKRWRVLLRLRQIRRILTRRNKTAAKSVKPSTNFSKLVKWVCGYLGVRVGEASHPGPAQGNKRKAESDPEYVKSNVDASLAHALLNVLQQFQGHSAMQPAQKSPPAKKGKGGPTPVLQRSQLARVLGQTLQAALSQGWTDQQVAQRLINKIN